MASARPGGGEALNLAGLEPHVAKALDVFDTDGNGFVSVTELREAAIMYKTSLSENKALRKKLGILSCTLACAVMLFFVVVMGASFAVAKLMKDTAAGAAPAGSTSAALTDMAGEPLRTAGASLDLTNIPFDTDVVAAGGTPGGRRLHAALGISAAESLHHSRRRLPAAVLASVGADGGALAHHERILQTSDAGGAAPTPVPLADMLLTAHVSAAVLPAICGAMREGQGSIALTLPVRLADGTRTSIGVTIPLASANHVGCGAPPSVHGAQVAFFPPASISTVEHLLDCPRTGPGDMCSISALVLSSVVRPQTADEGGSGGAGRRLQYYGDSVGVALALNASACEVHLPSTASPSNTEMWYSNWVKLTNCLCEASPLCRGDRGYLPSNGSPGLFEGLDQTAPCGWVLPPSRGNFPAILSAVLTNGTASEAVSQLHSPSANSMCYQKGIGTICESVATASVATSSVFRLFTTTSYTTEAAMTGVWAVDAPRIALCANHANVVLTFLALLANRTTRPGDVRGLEACRTPLVKTSHTCKPFQTSKATCFAADSLVIVEGEGGRQRPLSSIAPGDRILVVLPSGATAFDFVYQVQHARSALGNSPGAALAISTATTTLRLTGGHFLPVSAAGCAGAAFGDAVMTLARDVRPGAGLWTAAPPSSSAAAVGAGAPLRCARVLSVAPTTVPGLLNPLTTLSGVVVVDGVAASTAALWAWQAALLPARALRFVPLATAFIEAPWRLLGLACFSLPRWPAVVSTQGALLRAAAAGESAIPPTALAFAALAAFSLLCAAAALAAALALSRALLGAVLGNKGL